MQCRKFGEHKQIDKNLKRIDQLLIYGGNCCIRKENYNEICET